MAAVAGEMAAGVEISEEELDSHVHCGDALTERVEGGKGYKTRVEEKPFMLYALTLIHIVSYPL